MDDWSLYGFVTQSKKQDIKIRRIITKSDNKVWQIHPAFIMPYMTCETNQAAKFLFLSNWVPDWALAEIFGRNSMFY